MLARPALISGVQLISGWRRAVCAQAIWNSARRRHTVECDYAVCPGRALLVLAADGVIHASKSFTGSGCLVQILSEQRRDAHAVSTTARTECPREFGQQVIKFPHCHVERVENSGV